MSTQTVSVVLRGDTESGLAFAVVTDLNDPTGENDFVIAAVSLAVVNVPAVSEAMTALCVTVMRAITGAAGVDAQILVPGQQQGVH